MINYQTNAVTGNSLKHKGILKTEQKYTNRYITEEGVFRSKPEGLTDPFPEVP
jgi:hypothetical protein